MTRNAIITDHRPFHYTERKSHRTATTQLKLSNQLDLTSSARTLSTYYKSRDKHDPTPQTMGATINNESTTTESQQQQNADP